MAARAGMGTVIQRLRAETRTGTADYTVNSVAYWSDDQLQAYLDQNRTDVFRHALKMIPTYDDGGGTARYRHYYFPVQEVERAESGTVAWEVKDSVGNLVGTADYTVNYNSGLIKFTDDRRGTAYYLNYRRFDLMSAAADVWMGKAADLAETSFDLKTEGHTFNRSNLFDVYVRMADSCRSRAGVMAQSFLRRGDM